MMTRSELKSLAKEQLKGKWGMAILITLLYGILCSISVVNLIIGGALTLGLASAFLTLARNDRLQIDDLFNSFTYFGKALCLFLVTGIFIFLWSLLFIIPGIVAAYRYSMVYYIMADNPDMDVMQIIEESKKMMCGHKGELFVLDLSFIGWGILCVITFGIGFLWLTPYMEATRVNYYENLRGVTSAYGAIS